MRGGPARLVGERPRELVGVDGRVQEVVARRAGARLRAGVDRGVLRVGIEVAPDREAAQRAPLRSARRAGPAVPELLSVLRENELDEARAELAVVRAAQERDGVARDRRAAAGRDVEEALDALRGARRLRLDAAVEVDADARRGVARGDVLRGLARR